MSSTLIVLVVLSVGNLAYAQSQGDEYSVHKGGLSTASTLGPMTPPVLLRYVDAPYPRLANAPKEVQVVRVELSVDKKGKVTEVTVIDSPGEPFERAAVAAGNQFLFSAAMRDGEPIESTVKYSFRFHPPLQEASSLGDPEIRFSGSVLNMRGEPIGSAHIRIGPMTEAGHDLSNKPVVDRKVDDDGVFVVQGIAAGSYLVEIWALGFQPLSTVEFLEKDENKNIIYRLLPEASAYETVVRGDRVHRQVTRRSISSGELAKIPGTHGDALLGLQNLPGVARLPLMSGMLFIRGSSAKDSQFALDGLNTVGLYHFGGVNSIINSDLVKSVDFYPGNFSVRYGRSTGGIVSVQTREPRTDRFHGYVDADVWDAGLLVEGPIQKKWSIAVSGRRSYIDGLLKSTGLLEERLQLSILPRYYDFQVVTDYHPTSRNRVRTVFFGADDKIVSGIDEDAFVFSFPLNSRYNLYKAQTDWRCVITDRLTHRLMIGGSLASYDAETSAGVRGKSVSKKVQVRDEWLLTPDLPLALTLGTEINFHWLKEEHSYRGGTVFYDDETTHTETDRNFGSFSALYAELELSAIPKTSLVYGFRAEYYSAKEQWALDPRFTARITPLAGTAIKAGIGLFHQPSPLRYDSPFRTMSSIHYSLGIEQTLPGYDVVDLELEGFYKDLRWVPKREDDFFSDGDLIDWRSDSSGRSYGMELILRHRPNRRFFGWVAYTLMKSELFGHWEGAKPAVPFFDQRHILSVVGSVHVGWGVDVGLRFRLSSGLPYTPIVSSHYNADHHSYRPVLGEHNSARVKLFHQLDLRIDKKWQWRLLSLVVYLDVQNVYNRFNEINYAYSFDGFSKQVVGDLPVLPSLGLKLEY